MHWKRVLAPLIALALITCADTAIARPDSQPSRVATTVDVPMLLSGNSPAVSVMVNGRGPFLFMIDTGAQGAARADSSLVADLALKPAGSALSGDASGHRRSLEVVTIKSIRIGSLSFGPMDVPSRDYNGPTKKAPIAGILGFNLFRNYLLTLDFVHRRVVLQKGQLPHADGKTVLDYDAPYDTPVIEAVMGGLRLAADIDSGDNGGISFPEWLTRAMVRASTPKDVGHATTVTGSYPVQEVRLAGVLRIGEDEIAQPNVRYSQALDNINLGAAFLKDYIITFDQRNRRVRLVRGQAEER